METLHRITANVAEPLRKRLLAAGFDVPLGYEAFEVSENDPRWRSLIPILGDFDCGDRVTSIYSKQDLREADVLAMEPSWHHGYPEPSDDDGFKEATFDLSDYCKTCGIGFRQRAPFRLIKAPKWGNKSVFQLNWVFDEYFVRPEIWETVFKPFGVNCRPAVLNRSGETLDSVVQLDIPTLVEVEVGDHPFEVCPVCGRKKFEFFRVGPSPRPVEFPAAACKSSIYVGSGASASRIVMIRQDLYLKIAEAALKGITFAPCAG